MFIEYKLPFFIFMNGYIIGFIMKFIQGKREIREIGCFLSII